MKSLQKAINQMDKHSRQEVLDNDWLKREVDNSFISLDYGINIFI